MTRGRVYSKEEMAELRASRRSRATPTCPRCRTKLAARPIEANRQVSYVRRRTWWICPTCGRSAVLDDETKKL
jgi:uncharacterized protein with PIN domain